MVLAIHKAAARSGVAAPPPAVLLAAALPAAVLSIVGLSLPARAQSPTGLLAQAPASQGKTDVAKEGFQTNSAG